MSRILLGVAGGIAAYKAADLLRRLTESGHDVTVVPTEAALEFVGAATWSALSGKPVHTGVFAEVEKVPHVALGRHADLVLVAPATADLLARPLAARAAEQDLAGVRVVVSAGGTREPLDPVRFIGNASSGLMGFALARAARLRGAEVQLVAANVSLPAPAGVAVTAVGSTLELQDQMIKSAATADAVVMAAAPADFRPAEAQQSKIKKTSSDSGLELSLVQNPDILADLVQRRTDPGQVLVGFAAETADSPHELLELGWSKLARKGCDLLVLNAVGGGKVFGRTDSEIRLLSATDSAGGGIGGGVAGTEPEPLTGRKDTLAHHIWDAVARIRADR